MPARMTAQYDYDYDGMGVNDYVAQRIRTARVASGMTQRDVAARMVPPRSHVAVGYVELGRTAITVEMLMCFAVLFDKPLTWFLPGGDEM